MVYTLMTFSYVVIEGFRTMGYDMTEASAMATSIAGTWSAI